MWENLKNAIARAINANGNQEITGPLLQNVLNNIVSNLGENYTFCGLATLSTSPGVPDGPVFYLATKPGTYTDFGGIKLNTGEIAILSWSESWSKTVVGFDSSLLTYTSISNFKQGYYFDSAQYAVGDSFGPNFELKPLATANFATYKVRALKGSTIQIKGKGGSANSRLYLIVNRETNTVSHVAAAGETYTGTPLSITLEADSDIYFTFATRGTTDGIYLIVPFDVLSARVVTSSEHITTFRDYAGIFNVKPTLNTAAKTFTIPAGAAIISSSNNYHLNLAQALVYDGSGLDYGSSFLILDTVTLAQRIVNTNAQVKLDTNECVLALVRWAECVFQGNFSAYWLDDILINLKPKTQQNIDVPRMYNPPINLKKSFLYILDLGNSYTDDATALLPLIATKTGSNLKSFSIAKCRMDGASFKDWYNVIVNDIVRAPYTISHVVGNSDIQVGNIANDYDNSDLMMTIRDYPWDAIIIHQVSAYANSYETWLETSEGGYLKELIGAIRKERPDISIGFLLTHSYDSDYSLNTEKSTYKRWLNIVDATKKLVANFGIDFVIPYGTAIENIRLANPDVIGSLTRDGTHLGFGLARYTAACCYYQTVLAPHIGISVLGNTARYTATEAENNEALYAPVDVTDNNAPVAQKAAFLATYNWHDNINPNSINL